MEAAILTSVAMSVQLTLVIAVAEDALAEEAMAAAVAAVVAAVAAAAEAV